MILAGMLLEHAKKIEELNLANETIPKDAVNSLRVDTNNIGTNLWELSIVKF